MMMRFIYLFMVVFVCATLVVFLMQPPLALLAFILNNLSDLDKLLSKAVWTSVFQVLWKEMPIIFSSSIVMGVTFAALSTAVNLFDRSLAPNLRTRWLGLGILVVFMFCLFYVARYYEFIPLKRT